MYDYKIVSEGEIIRITGPVIDVKFAEKTDPSINTILYAKNDEGKDGRVWMEVASQIGNSVVRCIALEATEGLACGMKVYNTGEPITVPVGDNILGRVVNVMGEAIDGKAKSRQTSIGLSIVRLRRLRNKIRSLKFLKPALK